MQSAMLPPPKKNIPRVNTIIITVMIPEMPMAPIFWDRSARFAVNGCSTTARIFAAASVIPICALA